MAPIPIRASSLIPQIERVGHIRTQVVGRAAVDGFGKRVRTQSRKTVGKALVYLELKTVVPASKIVAQQEPERAQNARLKDHTLVDVLVGGGFTRDWRINKLARVVSSKCLDLRANFTRIGRFYHQIVLELALNRKTPGLDVGCSQ